jgi:hypothetical protein
MNLPLKQILNMTIGLGGGIIGGILGEAIGNLIVPFLPQPLTYWIRIVIVLLFGLRGMMLGTKLAEQVYLKLMPKSA